MAKGKEFQTKITIGGAVAKSLSKALGITEKEVSQTMGKVAKVGKAVGKVAVAMGAAAATGAVAIGKAAIDSYAEYEQLVGGVETLFGDSQKKVLEYANGAYKTAGLSANEYMSTVTSFSASLLNSLGGDTAKASEYAHQAIVDMSDNANKMGTDMASIQQTYQSLAKGNYGMLDNLKLGYGGTKTEMQRLIKEAAALDDSVDANSMSFGNIVKAIHAVQENMGITGTTAKEASTTISGSISAMKSAWQNLMTGVVGGDVALDTLIDNFADSFITVANNLLPKVSAILRKLPTLVEGLLPLIPPMIEKLLPIVINGTISILKGVGDLMPQLIQSVVSAIGQIITGAFAEMPTPILIIGGALAALTLGIKAYNAVMTVKKIIDKVHEKGLWSTVKAQLAANAAFLACPIFWIIAGIVALVAAFVILWNKFEGFRNFWKTTWEVIKVVALTVWELIKSAFFAAVEYIKAVFTPIIAYFQMIFNNIKLIFGVIGDVLSGDFQGAKDKIMQIFGNIGDFFKKVFESIKTAASVPLKWLTDKFDIIKNGIEKVKEVFGWGGKETKVKAYANGGTVTRPHMAIVGDAPETIVPHGNTARNRALLAEAAANVTGGATYGGVTNITFAPVIQGGSGADVKRAITESEIEFEQKMDRYFKKKGRVSFA